MSSIVVVLIHHEVDGGSQYTQLFESTAGAEKWLEENGYRREKPNDIVWRKPAYSEWDAPEYVACPGAYEIEIAEVYWQTTRP